MGSAMVESVSVIPALKMAYVVFPTKSAARTTFRVNPSFKLIDDGDSVFV